MEYVCLKMVVLIVYVKVISWGRHVIVPSLLAQEIVRDTGLVPMARAIVKQGSPEMLVMKLPVRVLGTAVPMANA